MAVMMMARVAGVAPVALTKKCWKFLKRPKNIVNMSTKIFYINTVLENDIAPLMKSMYHFPAGYRQM